MTKLRRDMTWLEKLQELCRMANYETANFDPIGGGDVVIEDGKVTDFIRERTRLYRNSWINPIIDELIEREQRARDRRKKRQR
jgi:hypothetical protein